MGSWSECLEEEHDAVVLHVHVQLRARRDAVVGRHGDAVKIRVHAAPERGNANEAVVAVLAETFGIPRSAVELVSGAASRAKRVRLRGLRLPEVTRRLELVGRAR